MIDTRDVAVFLGLDVGKGEHHATGMTPNGKQVVDKPLPNSEPKLRAVLDKLTAKYGRVLVVVDQRSRRADFGRFLRAKYVDGDS
ncbi:hypothetical protein GCM10017744_001060 [Streptomyces antimycoticus]|uniref:Transposase IS110-like N-terminal domain-containing protein n=1 Tax=Streptomyces antimycoticus TaxID=68175 RepID=A0A4D4KT02_9ACTN|nr:hypothetical protein SANT12839_098610 [Streptomyces antimycoticus]